MFFQPTEILKITKPIRLIELFAGVGAQAKALKNINANFEHYAVCEFDEKAVKSYNAIHCTNFQTSDITKIHAYDLNITDTDVYEYLMTYSFPCFTEDALVSTINGLVRIKDIKVGDRVLTHDGTYQSVTDSRCTGENELYSIRTQMGGLSKCTGNHRIYVRKKYFKYDNKRRSNIRLFSEPYFEETSVLSVVDKFSDYYVGMPVNSFDCIPEWSGISIQWDVDKRPNRCDVKNEISDLLLLSDFWWLIGRYVADGWVRSEGGICIAFPDCKKQELLKHVDRLNIHYTVSVEKTCNRLHVPRKEWSAFVEPFCKGAYNKIVPQFVLNLPKHLLKSFILGYLSGDGNRNINNIRATSVSKQLVYGMTQAVAKAFNRVSGLYYNKSRGKSVIDGRTVNSRESWTFQFKEYVSKQDKAFFENGFVWFPIMKIEKLPDRELTYDISVENNHTFVVNNMIVHNCTDLSTAGRGLGMSENSGTRSSLLWEVKRLLQECDKLPQILLMENVTQVHLGNNRQHFHKWCEFLKSLGYTSYVKDLCASDYGIPQTRLRTFMVSVLGESMYEFPSKEKLTMSFMSLLDENVNIKYYVMSDFGKHVVNRFLHGQHLSKYRNVVSSDLPISTYIYIPQSDIDFTVNKCGCFCGNISQDQRCSETDDNPTRQRLSLKSKQILGTLTTVSKDNVIFEMYRICSEISEKASEYFRDCIYECDSVRYLCLIRYLTPKECFRFMGFSTSDFESIQNLNFGDRYLYKQSGNSIVVNVLMEIFRKML